MTNTAEPDVAAHLAVDDPLPAAVDPLWTRLRAVEERVRHAVGARQAKDPDPEDPYRGQYLTPEAAARILDEPGGLDVPGEEPWQPPAGSVLDGLARRFGLSELDLDLLLVAMAPDLDARFERLYGYLNDDLTRRRPTVGLALELCGLSGTAPARFRLAPGAPLIEGGLVQVTEPERPPLSRVLVVPDRVTGHLLGSAQPDAQLAGVLGEAREDPTAQEADVRLAAAAATTGVGLVHLRSRGGDAEGLAAAALHAAGLRPLALDAVALARRPAEVPELARAVAREARLTGAGVVLGPLEALPAEPAERVRTLRALCAALRGIPLFTHGTGGWAPEWAADTPVVLTVPAPSPERQAARWRHALERAAGDGSATGGVAGFTRTAGDDPTPGHLARTAGDGSADGRLPRTDGGSSTTGRPARAAGIGSATGDAGAFARTVGEGVSVGDAGALAGVGEDAAAREVNVLAGVGGKGVTAGGAGALARAVGDGVATGDAEELALAVAAHRLDAGQLRRAADVAVRTAVLAGRPVRPDDVRAAVRAQNGAGLDRLARRVEPGVGWDDLVLPPTTHRRLRELALRARHREQVLGQWGMRPGGGRGRGVIALFAGESGTGKTMSAEVVAADLGMDLYVVDLSTVVDKYIGETEKNLERIFTEASAVNAVLLFDEADAIFGKRSEVKDAHDRHANIESAYLLQRMESFDGIAVLTTNLRANLDEAFTRRLDVVADFPVPDAGHRLALWDRCLGDLLPRADDLDLAFCADRFELAGGSIRACAVTAAYLAAESGGPLTMRQVVTAVAQEYRKLGRLVLEGEFGPYLADAVGA
ncbi:ATP-binding protein [Streptomyces griseoincarnatus]|uniref:ATP-binding protein n=1 Tax=Streptomyces griseoincarnatus TaxID=29305 RepID=A0ABT0VSU2_STRGI|nr:ATP-binding protein [Streptomyces griseoincarnatus]MCM2514407.1 ATP-binding protein [Streptomyces griseoincarnatus]